MKTKIIHIPELDSTNFYLSGLIKKEDIAEGLVISTDFQKNGRGQRGNKWNSEQGKNILCSILLKPDFLPIDRQFLISKIISVSITDFLMEFIDNVKIKWPNDIYCANKKIGGILIENVLFGNKIDSTVIGIGININQTNFPERLPNPISLRLINGKNYDRKVLLNKLLKYIDKWYLKLRECEIETINELYHNRLYLLNKVHVFKRENKKIEGKITGVSELGMLIIENINGEKTTYNFKEIEF